MPRFTFDNIDVYSQHHLDELNDAYETIIARAPFGPESENYKSWCDSVAEKVLYQFDCEHFGPPPTQDQQQ